MSKESEVDWQFEETIGLAVVNSLALRKKPWYTKLFWRVQGALQRLSWKLPIIGPRLRARSETRLWS